MNKFLFIVPVLIILVGWVVLGFVKTGKENIEIPLVAEIPILFSVLK